MATEKHSITRIGIDAGSYNPADGVRSGIERLIAGFLNGLKNHVADNIQFYFYGFNPKHASVENAVARRLPKRFFSSLFLPAWLSFDRVQVYLGFSGVVAPFVRLLGVKPVVFIHDFAFLDHPENYGNPEKMKWQTEYALFSSEKVIVFSDYIKNQTLKRYPKLPVKKVVRIYPGGDHFGTAAAAAPSRKNPFFLYVGVIKPAKNILVLLSRFEKLVRLHKLANLKLILVGPQEPGYFSNIKDTVVYQKLRNRIEFREHVSDPALKQLYQNSLGLLNVSHEEGFCYPVVESLMLGKPAVVNDIPLYREFASYFPGLKIAATEEDFIERMLQLTQRPECLKPDTRSPFKWQLFTETLLQEIGTIKT